MSVICDCFEAGDTINRGIRLILVAIQDTIGSVEQLSQVNLQQVLGYTFRRAILSMCYPDLKRQVI
jgi:hypothetical protein